MSVYLDHNATTPADERVLGAMLPYLQECYGNPSSVYRRGRLARQAVEQAREQVAQLVNAHPAQVIFTSGGTEANNLAIKGAVSGLKCLAVSAVEHASVMEPARQLKKQGCELRQVNVDGSGRVSKTVMEAVLLHGPQLVSVMAANNETGVIQPVQQLAEMARAKGALFHTDAVQAAGKVPLDFNALGVQLMTLSAHKIYGPKGSGALVVDNHIDLSPTVLGGGQEGGRRSGTENVAAIVGFGVAAELAHSALADRRAHLEELRRYLEGMLISVEGVVVFAQEAERLPNTVFLAIPGIDGETLLMELDRQGIEVSSGSACDSKKIGSSHVLTAMGVDQRIARCAIRISFGQGNSRADADALVKALEQQVKALQSTSMLAWV